MRRFAAIFMCVLAGTVVAFGFQEAEKTAAQEYMNIQVLKDIPASQLDYAMRFMSSSLGVNCNYCHVTSEKGRWPFEKDDKEHKQVARRMIVMTREINERHFEGKQEVTCASCHNGREHPLAAPAMERLLEPQPSRADEKDLPTAPSLFERYAQALGGGRARELKTRVTKGVLVTGSGRNLPVEIHEKAPDKYLEIITTPSGTIHVGFNGETAWTRQGGEQFVQKGFEREQLARRANFFKDFRLAEILPRATVAPKEMVGDRETHVVRGRSSKEIAERLFFDTKTGLLLRRVVLTNTVLGPLPDQTDYDDYREVDGVRLPFLVRRFDRARVTTTKVSSVKHGVELGDAEFEPAPPPKQTGEN